MYTKHKAGILEYEGQYNVPSSHGGVTGIGSIRDELAPAIQVIADHLGITGGVDINDFDIMIDYLPEGSSDEVGTEFLEGDGENNIILGGEGNDTLEGGGKTTFSLARQATTALSAAQAATPSATPISPKVA